MIRALMLSRKKDGIERQDHQNTKVSNISRIFRIAWNCFDIYLFFNLGFMHLFFAFCHTIKGLGTNIPSSYMLGSSTSRRSGNEPATSENRAHLQVPRKMSITSAHTGSSDSSLKKPEKFLQFMRAGADYQLLTSQRRSYLYVRYARAYLIMKASRE